MFQIQGANSDDISVESQAIIIGVVISYSTSNVGPELVTDIGTVIAHKNQRTTVSLGEIIDKENDQYFLKEWSLSSDE